MRPIQPPSGGTGTPSEQISRSVSVLPTIFDISCQGPVLTPSGTVRATRTGRSTARYVVPPDPGIGSQATPSTTCTGDEQVSSCGVGTPQRRTTAGSPHAATPASSGSSPCTSCRRGNAPSGSGSAAISDVHAAVVAPGASTDETGRGSVMSVTGRELTTEARTMTPTIAASDTAIAVIRRQ